MTGRNISLRTRLTLIYGSLFLLMGVVLETATYLATSTAVNAKFRILLDPPTGSTPPGVFNQSPTLVQTDPPTGGTTQAGSPQSELIKAIKQQRQAILNQLIQSSVVALIAVAVLAIVLGYIVSGRMLRPLRQITATGQRLSESNLHERIALTGPQDEIKELADTFDSMLDRLHRAFDSQRRFIANAAHELRTPLAINRTIIDVAMAKPGAPEPVRALGQKLLGTITRNERLLDGLLLMARSERELRDRSPLDLAVLADGAVEQLHQLTLAAGITLTPLLKPAPTAGDPLLLERCAVNLIENAIKYNDSEAQIWIQTGQTQGRSWLQVENTGALVSAEQAQAIFEPFRRLHADRVGSARGAGLGLSIVRAIAQAHDGVVRAYPRPAGGLIVTLQVPAATLSQPNDLRIRSVV